MPILWEFSVSEGGDVGNCIGFSLYFLFGLIETNWSTANINEVSRSFMNHHDIGGRCLELYRLFIIFFVSCSTLVCGLIGN